MTNDAAQVQKPYIFYGRRQGKALSTRQKNLEKSVLPALLLKTTDQAGKIHAVFPKIWQEKERCLEIGFGSGEHLLTRLQKNKDCVFLGAEPFRNGLLKVVSAAQDGQVSSESLRLWDRPIQDLWAALPRNFFHKIYILCPDPWPKKRQQKRRLLNQNTLQHCARILAPGGHLVLATDDADYANEMMRLLNDDRVGLGPLQYKAGRKSCQDPVCPAWPAAWPQTRYMNKALSAGRQILWTVQEKQ